MRIALPPAIAMAAFADRDPVAAIVDLTGETMGTSWSVLFAARAGIEGAAIRAAIVARLEGLVSEMSHWAPSSELCRFNRAAADTWVTMPPDFAHVMARGFAIAARTRGAFDPAIGRLVDLWGFGPRSVTGPPSEAQITGALAMSGWHRLRHDASAGRLRQPGGLALDLSGIAKGHAVDAVADLLETAGIHHSLTEIGGELVGRGVRPDGEPWWVDLEVPPGADIAPLRIALHGLAVATSGNYRRGGHTIDPRGGRPIDHGVFSVSVLHATALEADAWATALTVLPPEEAIQLAGAEIAARILWVADGATCEAVTPALAAMLVYE